jgi:hypothetical protein
MHATRQEHRRQLSRRSIAMSEDTVEVERHVLEELVDCAQGDLERMVSVEGFDSGDHVVDRLASVVEKGEAALEGGRSP